MRLLLAAALALTFAASADARTLQCTFETQCMAGDACEEAGYELTATFGEDSDLVELADVNETLPATGFAGGDGTVVGAFHAKENGDAYLLTVARDGRATYSVHYPGSEIALVYSGTCGAGAD